MLFPSTRASEPVAIALACAIAMAIVAASIVTINHMCEDGGDGSGVEDGSCNEDADDKRR